MITKHKIPIYGALLWIVIDKDIYKRRQKLTHVFGKDKEKGYEALHTYNPKHGRFGIFLKPKACKDTIAHEVFHITHKILDWVGANFDLDHDEQGAYLNGHLTDLIYKDFKKSRK